MPEPARPKPRRRDRRGRFLPRTREERFAWIEGELGVGEMGRITLVHRRPNPDPNNHARLLFVVAMVVTACAGDVLWWWEIDRALPVALAIGALACGAATLLWSRRRVRIVADRYGVSVAGRGLRGEVYPWADLRGRHYLTDGYELEFRQGVVVLPKDEKGRAVFDVARSVLMHGPDRIVPTSDDLANLPPDAALSPAQVGAAAQGSASRALSRAAAPDEGEELLDT